MVRMAPEPVVAVLAETCVGVSCLNADAGKDTSPELEGLSWGVEVDPIMVSLVGAHEFVAPRLPGRTMSTCCEALAMSARC
jgi:hypothetical protein